MTDQARNRPSEVGMHRWASWGLVCVIVVVGCGGRTLVESEVDGGPEPTSAENTPPASGSSSGAASNTGDRSGDASGPQTHDGSTATDPGDTLPFFVCPFDPPVLHAACDTPGLVCVYQGFGGCSSYECDSSGWQASHQGC
jgi:hypothetical protein